MPSEILNQLESNLPEIEAPAAKGSTSPPTQNEPLDKLKAEMRAMKFLWNLPTISIDFLREDELLCGLCDKRYDDDFTVCSRGESPCCLPCGHVAGHQCLRAYLSPYESAFTGCPFAGCNVDFPQMYTDLPVEFVAAAQPTTFSDDLAPRKILDDTHDASSSSDDDDDDDEEPDDEELARQISELSNDSGASHDEVERYLSINEVLGRFRNESVEDSSNSNAGTEVQDFAALEAAAESPLPEAVGEDEFPKNRRGAVNPSLMRRTAKRTVDLIAKNF